MNIPPEDKYRLQAIREYLDVQARIDDSAFAQEVVAVSSSKLSDIYISESIANGEDFIFNIAENLNIAFEEIHLPEDIASIRDKYLNKKELGFGQLELELQNSDIDALLFKRQHKPNHYVAVLNLQETSSRAYWNRAHETSHRLIEPPQQELFHRHRANQENTVEHIVDLVAAEIAFFEPIFKPIVESYPNMPLSWEVVEKIRNSFAPTSSLMAVTKAIIKFWSMPVFLIEAEFRGRKSNNSKDQALRTSVIDSNLQAKSSGIFFFSNMRAAGSSPIQHAFTYGISQEGQEDLSNWVTSNMRRLPSRNSFTCARPYGRNIIALITPI